jgi:CHAD domain-containing protein
MPIASEQSRLAFQKVERCLLKLSSGQQPERVHDFRTAVRRLQTLLVELVPERSRNQKKLLKLLVRIRRRAGRVRDLDVQLAALRSLKIPQEPRRKTQLIQQLLELRAEHEKRLRKMLTKGNVREIRRRLKRAARESTPSESRDPLAIAKQTLALLTPPDGEITEEMLHQYRILGKRARYAAEFAAKSPEAERLIGQLRRTQDALGDWHDWLTLTQTATKRLGDMHESSLVAVLHNVTRVKFRNAVSALSAWKSQAATKLALRPAARRPGVRTAVPAAPAAQASSAA